MEFKAHFHRFSNLVVTHEEAFAADYAEITSTIGSISDSDLIEEFQTSKAKRTNIKSLSEPINALLKKRLSDLGWQVESPIFTAEPYESNKAWRLDFAKNNISVEVAFNHGEATAHNILKPVLASELNHVPKKIQTRLGIIITATDELKARGGFDGAVGTYSKFVTYLMPYSTIIAVPLIIIGLLPPSSFCIRDKSITYL